MDGALLGLAEVAPGDLRQLRSEHLRGELRADRHSARADAGGGAGEDGGRVDGLESLPAELVVLWWARFVRGTSPTPTVA